MFAARGIHAPAPQQIGSIVLTQAGEFTSAYGLYQWYDHVRLAEGQVIGQSLSLAAETGHCLWQRQFRRPNTYPDRCALPRVRSPYDHASD